MSLIGITEEQLAQLVEDAVKRGYEAARRDLEQSEWLTFSEATFNRNRAKGMYGQAIIGSGFRCKARKSDLLDAMKMYQLSTL